MWILCIHWLCYNVSCLILHCSLYNICTLYIVYCTSITMGGFQRIPFGNFWEQLGRKFIGNWLFSSENFPIFPIIPNVFPANIPVYNYDFIGRDHANSLQYLLTNCSSKSELIRGDQPEKGNINFGILGSVYQRISRPIVGLLYPFKTQFRRLGNWKQVLTSITKISRKICHFVSHATVRTFFLTSRFQSDEVKVVTTWDPD